MTSELLLLLFLKGTLIEGTEDLESDRDSLPLALDQNEVDMIIYGQRTHLQGQSVKMETNADQANISLIGFLSAIRKRREHEHPFICNSRQLLSATCFGPTILLLEESNSSVTSELACIKTEMIQYIRILI